MLDRSSSKEGGEMSPDTQEESQHPVDQEEYSERGERDNNIRGVTSPGVGLGWGWCQRMIMLFMNIPRLK